ncbi:MAG: hypothetical protein ACYS5V_14910, partial [Planctomycetota bacterium]
MEERPGLAVTAPMLDPELPAGEVKRCPEPDDLLVAGLSGSFQALAALKKADKAYSGLDKIALPE